LERLNYIARAQGHFALTAAPSGYDAFLAAEAAKRRAGTVLFVSADDAAAQAAVDAIAFFAPDLHVLPFPAWDCLPYDRLSPKPDIESQRLATLAALAARGKDSGPAVVIAPVHSLLQRVPPRAAIRDASFFARVGQVIEHEQLVNFIVKNGYARASTVREPGDFALRGGIVDLWPPGVADPLRLDFFGSSVEAIKRFDAETQLSNTEIAAVELLPASETPLDAESISRFRSGYVAAFGPPGPDDLLYEAVSAGRKHPGMEHWLPLFYPELETLFDYLDAPLVFASHQMEEARAARHALIADYYETRRQLLAGSGVERTGSGPPYRPLPPEQLYLSEAEWNAALAHRLVRELSPFQAPESLRSVDAGGKPGRDFAPERSQGRINVFEAAAEHIKALQKARKRVLVAAWSSGSAERLGGVLADHGLSAARAVENWPDALSLSPDALGIGVLCLEHGFEAPDIAILTEQDILGERMLRPRAKVRRAQNFLAEATTLAAGDLVTHIEHGIGRYAGLQTIDAAGAPHDCLELQYEGGKLFLPVENIELLTRYGGDEGAVQLDRLGGAGWQQRKARMKQRVREIAAELIRIAASRQLKSLPAVDPPQGLYDEFCARFPWQETEDQDRAIAETIEDLAKGRPMDRLVCGDVGFGKTEVALRATFVEAMAGWQVAVVVPTTLLARQHYNTFCARFQGFPVKVRQLSRFVSAKEARETKAGLASGDIDIVIGTHALLAKSISFKRLGLVIVDEEQHFGVVHKERLKALKADVHVLTLSATPIPRTLQLALTGVRDLSLITTPPVDRLAVRTFVTPFDALTVREALLREHYRGGQSFYVCARIADIADAMDFLKHTVPEVKIAIGHGQMPPAALEDVMTAFYEGKTDVLVSTNIVESGLDIPTANTLVVHRADIFGLSQLYQLRGRIGRSKQRAYAYLTTPADRKLTETAERRLQVLQSLDQLGAGFSVASHDLDIRGAGNLLGEEQSGHVREVGIELYQEMLEEAVAQLRSGAATEADEQWSPQINIGTSVLIPETYVPDLDVRMALYRRLASLEDAADIDRFAAELIDRFGALPDEVQHLLDIVAIKALCRQAQVEKIEAGPKGATITFRNNSFPNPAGLVRLIAEHQSSMRVRPDQKVVIARDWQTAEMRLKGVQTTLSGLVRLAQRKAA
jgi:transcription-repair coupling factor (superfamily II helicase)